MNYDVIVAGSGPAGIAAAIAAARGGAATALIEKNPFAGGTWTAGMMCLVLDHENKAGIMGEIKETLRKENRWVPFRDPKWAGIFPVEPMKMLLDEMLLEAGVSVRYHTLIQGAERNGRTIAAVTTASKSGREEWRAKAFVDATGDGDLGAFAGCGFEKGRESDGKMQPGTMFGLVGGWPDPLPDGLEVTKELDKQGFDLSYRGVIVKPQAGQPGMAVFMASHLYGVDSTNAASLTEAEIEGRRQVHGAVECLRESGNPRFAGLFVAGTGPFLTVREGRRIHGLYTLTADDARAGRKFDDGVCEVTFNFDVHHVDPSEGRFLDAENVPPYQIPYRCLVAKDADNLLLAGRCISGDFLAHSSYRVTGNAAALGETAGAAAALSVKSGTPVADVDASAVSQIR